MIRPCSQTHIQGSWVRCCLISLKLESCKFNIIINIINITLGLSVVTKLKAFGQYLQKNLTLLDLSIFWYFLCKKKNLTYDACFCFFFSPFLFKPFIVDCIVQSTVKKLMSLVFFVFFLIIFFKFSFLILNFFYLIIRLSWHGSQVWQVNSVYPDCFSFSWLVFFFLPVGFFFSFITRIPGLTG